MCLKNRLNIAVSVIAMIALCAACDNDKGQEPDDEPDRSEVWVDTIDAYSGDQVQLDVFAISKIPLQGLGLPLKLTGTGFSVDSVSFVGTMLQKRPSVDFVGIDDTSSATVITISILRAYTKLNFIEPGSGVLASIFVTLSQTAGSQVIDVDTCTVAHNSLQFADTADVGSVPFFTPGEINVAPAPSGNLSDPQSGI
jgi:hypothetical protein